MSFTLTARTAAPTAPAFTRSVIHHARPPRRPHYPSPLSPLTVKPTAGTSRPQPALKNGSAPAHTELSDAPVQGLTFHYAPPPSAPSYTTGVVPDLIRWTGGARDVRADPQAGAPFKSRKPRLDGLEVVKSLTAEVVGEIQRLRAEDPVKWTRKALGERFSIPASQTHHLARLAPASKSHRQRLENDLDVARSGWTWRKRFARDAREVRKEFW